MDIDLGQKAKAKVKVNGQEFFVSLPTVAQAEKFQKDLKDSGDDGSINVFRSLVSELGIPDETLKDLDIHQFQKLAEGLLGLAEKK